MNTPQQIKNYLNRQKIWKKSNNLKPGDLLLVTKEPKLPVTGWNCLFDWTAFKTKATVGKVFQFQYEGDFSIVAGSWVFPYTILRKIEVKKEGDIPEKGDILYSINRGECYPVVEVHSFLGRVNLQISPSCFLHTNDWRFATKKEIINYYNNLKS